MTNDEYWFWLCNIKGIWQQDIKRLFTVFSGPEEIFKASPEQILASDTVTPEQAAEICSSREDSSFINGRLEYLRKNNIRFIHRESPDFPDKFKFIPDSPYSFYLRGSLPDPDVPSVGIVGARACSPYGREMTLRFSKKLAEYGIQTVSGMAHGIDAHSAEGTLAAGGRAFAVLGSGIDVIYPRENISLYYEIILSGGIISEYPPGTNPISWQFPHRNRLISALSDILLVMEARKRSGTLITANYALEQSKEIFALPGRADDPLSAGCNNLIADGAGILLNPEQLIEHILKICPRADDAEEGAEKLNHVKFPSPECKKIFLCCGRHAKSVQTIIQESRCNAQEVAAALIWLELNGLVEEISTDYYIRLP